MAFAVDLAAPTTQRLRKFINGENVGTEGLGGADSRLSLLSSALLFTTGDRSGVYTQPGCVNSIQFVDGVLSNEQIAALAGPRATGIPLFQILSLSFDGARVTLRWKAAPNVLLQRATRLTNPDWEEVPFTQGDSSYGEAVSDSTMAFFRLTTL